MVSMPPVPRPMMIQAYQHPEPGDERGTDTAGHRHNTATLLARKAGSPLQDLEVEQEEHKGGGEEEEDTLHCQAHFCW